MTESDFDNKIKSEIPERPTAVNAVLDTTHIKVNDIAGPLVVFFGPRNIGKTVALLRLCNYLDRYDISPDRGFRSDKEEYDKTIAAFTQLKNNTQFAPDATGKINFLLLNVSHNGKRVCQILEAPGEHFFDIDEKGYSLTEFQPYLNSVFRADHRKIFIFCFSLNMFDDDDTMKRYNNHIATVIKDKLIAKRDRIIILCTKANLSSAYIRDGKPVNDAFKGDLYSKRGFNLVEENIKNGGFKKVPFIPFSSGDFTPDSTGRKIFVMSPDFYPEKLWDGIHDALTGGGSIFKKLFGR